eukprot:TRINITY_DN1371_c0_g1_i1.p4 TRINITY_DN1371_c0_g1~~TRINITY_DN1371_c0_g1_i1.p4  ORF type:complete len:449 (+),score=64.45 TRINITY_DN1371_c0_g1_i1:17727-19073(+)
MKAKASKRKSVAAKEEIKTSKRKKVEIETPTSITGWTLDGSLLLRDYDSKPSDKIISFDLDGTLIETKSGATFAKNKTDWKLWNSRIPTILKDYLEKGYRVVVFSNQAGLGGGKVKMPDFQEKLDAIQKALGVPLLVVAATQKDEYRKPDKGMWRYFNEKLNGGIKVDLSASYYVGDAAGRPAAPGRKKDFSDSDLKFALNVGLKFQTPEEFFLEKPAVGVPKVPPVALAFDPTRVPTAGAVLKGLDVTEKVTKDIQEVVIFVGPPAAGKSTFWQNYMSSYIRVNRDTLKTKEKCIAVLDKSLGEGKSCVVDNTSPTKEDRKLYINVAKKHGVPVRCFWFNVPKEMAMHMDKQRKTNTERKHLSKHVGRIPIFTYYKKFEMPEIAEGFTEVKEVHFVAKFESEKDKDMFNILSQTWINVTTFKSLYFAKLWGCVIKKTKQCECTEGNN